MIFVKEGVSLNLCMIVLPAGYCGHYAFHFTLCCLETCAAVNIRDVAGYLGETSSAAVFWRRYIYCTVFYFRGDI